MFVGPPGGRPGPPMHSGLDGPGPGPRMMHPHPNQGPEPLPPGPPMHGPQHMGESQGPNMRGVPQRMEPMRPMDPEPRPMHDVGPPGPREPQRPHDGPPRMDHGPRMPQGPQFRGQHPGGPNMGPPHHGGLQGMQQGPRGGPPPGRTLSPPRPQPHPGMPGMHPQQNVGNLPPHMQQHGQPGMPPQREPQVPFSEADRIVVGNRVIVPNVDQPTPMHGHMPAGFGGQPNAPPNAAVAAAAAAVAAASRQQYPFPQQFPFDYTMYGANWQQLLQQRDAYAAAAAYNMETERNRTETPVSIKVTTSVCNSY